MVRLTSRHRRLNILDVITKVCLLPLRRGKLLKVSFEETKATEFSRGAYSRGRTFHTRRCTSYASFIAALWTASLFISKIPRSSPRNNGSVVPTIHPRTISFVMAYANSRGKVRPSRRVALADADIAFLINANETDVFNQKKGDIYDAP